MAQVRHRLGKRRIDRLLVANIADLGMHAAKYGEFGARALSFVGIGSPDRHPSPGLRQRARHAHSDAAIAARDDSTASGEIKP